MHYCIFLYPKNSYKLTASGALLESLAHLKPVISLRNSYLEYIFNKMGNIGYLCSTIEEMTVIIKEISQEQDTNIYIKQQENIRSGLWYFSTDYLEDELLKIISRFY
jgi:glycosyltransferase involved in cell wall biosynthesis